MVTLSHTKVLVLREHDIKKTTLKRIKYKDITIFDIGLTDLYKHKYIERQIEICKEKGYPVVITINNVTRLLIFNRTLKC